MHLALFEHEQEARREQQEKENRGRNADRERNRVENGSEASAGHVSDFEKDSNAASSTNNDGKSHYEATQGNDHSEKDKSGSDENDRSFKDNRRKRNNNIVSDAVDNDDNPSAADKSSKEAAE